MKETTLLHKTIGFNPFDGPTVEKVIHTTPSQAEIWIACKMGGEDANRAYNESVSLILKGNLNRSALDNAVQKLVKRHEALRSTFSPDGQFMIVFEETPLKVSYQDLSNLTSSEKDEQISNYLVKDAHHVFDLIKGPLLKVGLLKLADLEHQLVITAHHTICDGWSMGIILEEIGTFYSAQVMEIEPNLPHLDTYSSYAIQDENFIESNAFKITETFWLKQYETTVPEVSMPTDYPRPPLRTYKSNRLDFPISNSLVVDLKKVGVKSGASFVTTLMAAFEIFLYFQTGQGDLVLGLPAAGQSNTGKNQLVGHCVNLLPLRSKIDPNIQFNDYLKKRKADIFDAYDHQQFSFGQLVQKLGIARDPSRVPLVPIVFNIDMGMAKAVSFEGLNFTLISNPRAFETFEIFLNATGTEDALILEWSYNTALFKPSTIAQMMASFNEILHTIVANPSIKIGHIIEIDYSAYSTLNNTNVSYPQLPLHDLLTNQAKQTPLNTALKFGTSEINYKNLQKQAHQLAHYLLEHGVTSGDFVAVSVPRSIELVVTLIAIMECGAAYLPLDPSYPVKRLEYMLEDSEANYLITTKTLSTSLQTGSEIFLLETIFSELKNFASTPPNIKVNNQDIAYMLYTSGSTGKPKGVTVTHKNLVNFLYSMLSEPGISETDKLLSITTISFDIAGLEIFAPLLKGAQLVLTNEETSKDSRLLLDLLENESITIMQATPTTWQMLLDTGWEQPLPIKALCGGEALPLHLAKNILDRVNELWNMYGPTETTIWSSVKQILKTDDLITIGHPIANTQIYILNEQGHLVEPGKIGELCIAGNGVANGYWKRPDLTAEKFIKNPVETDLDSILYKTGDLAKLLPSGEIQCLGRLDQQVKIRGHRIELGEIEQALDALKGVQSSVVIIHHDLLVANLIVNDAVSQDTNLINTWKEILKVQLPSHMLPTQFNFVTAFPKTLNGKIDRKALLNLISNKTSKAISSEPSTPSEKIITTIWQECLGLEKIDTTSDFFEIGGHSLIAVKVMTLIEKETGVRLPLAALLEYPTIFKLAAYLDSKNFKWNSLVPLKPTGTKPALYMIHGANHHVLMFNSLAHALSDDQPVYGLQSKGLNGTSEPNDTIEAMAADYISEIIASNPEGPYALAGFSYGGIVAFEMARQLRAKGKKVTILAQFDTYVFPQYYFENRLIKKLISVFYLIGKIVFLFLNMFSSKKNFKRRIGLIKLQIEGVFLKLKYGKSKQYELQFSAPLKVHTSHNKATEHYTISPQNIVVDLFRASEEVNFVHDSKYLGWKKIAQKGIRKHKVLGNHVDMFEKPHVKEFADQLQYVLDRHNVDNYE